MPTSLDHHDAVTKEVKAPLVAAGNGHKSSAAGPDPRKAAADRKCRAEKIVFDCEDALAAARKELNEATKAFDAVRKEK